MSCTGNQNATCGCAKLDPLDPMGQIAKELARLNDNLEKLFYRNSSSEPPSLSIMLQISPASIQSLQNLRNKNS